MPADKLDRFIASEDHLAVFGLKTWSVVRGLARGEVSRYHPRVASARRARRPAATPPYPISLYQRMIVRLADGLGTVLPLAEAYRRRRGVVVLRHDIDTAGCVARLPALTEVERRAGLSSTVVFRVDCMDYVPSIARDLARSLRREGFEIGLHSSAYTHSVPQARLSEEIEIFSDSFGFRPACYNFHGLGEVGLPQRLRLMMASRRVVRETPGLEASDSESGFYCYRVQDCHGSQNTRHLLSDFESPPLSLTRFGRMLVLTHPVYWHDELVVGT